MRIKCTLLMLPVCLTVAGGFACADNMLIKYRSGKVQTLRLDELSSTIMGISYQDQSVSVAYPSPSDSARIEATGANESAAPAQKSSGKPQANGKPPVRFTWAKPLE